MTLFIRPANAHNVTVSETIAGTWHIEPNDSPKAGETAEVWVALTRKGGEVLPLEQAACTLGVYSEPRSQGDEPILMPTLKAITAEQYQGIPGADVVFPKTGLYQLELSCTPKTEADFTPFRMDHQVTVASAGATATPEATPAPSNLPSNSPANSPESSPPSPLWVQGVGLGLGVSAAGVLVRLIGKLFGKRQ